MKCAMASLHFLLEPTVTPRHCSWVSTGAGKTSLARHLIGSDPDKDRFPSTSTAKTTVSDIELILAEGKFKAAVTFFSETTIQANIEDCILNACSAVWERLGEDKVADRFLHHPDQRFRLSYLLGSWKKGKAPDEPADDWDFGDSTQEVAAAMSSDEAVSAVAVGTAAEQTRGLRQPNHGHGEGAGGDHHERPTSGSLDSVSR